MRIELIQNIRNIEVTALNAISELYLGGINERIDKRTNSRICNKYYDGRLYAK